ncbi:MAG: hypothetical protein WA628_15160 [Terriglobales bacterium]
MSAAVITTFVPESSESTAAIERYERGYRAAETVVTFGETVRLGGIFLGGVVLVGALVELLLNPAERFGFPVGFASLIACAVLLVLVSQVLGMGFQGQGQLLKAALDSDVNSSPFLSNAQRAKTMSLRRQPSVPDSIRLRAA